MEKEYETARLFKNRRTTDGMNTDEPLDSTQEQIAEAQNSSFENSEPSKSDENNIESYLPPRIQRAVRRFSERFGLDRKE